MLPYLVLGATLLFAPACSIRKLAINTLADSLAASGAVFASDEDPELVRAAMPFGLKTIESLLAESPEHRGLLLSACSGFTQYAYAFVVTDALFLEAADYEAATRLRDRALKLYLRARDYCVRSLELDAPGIRRRLETEPESALVAFGPEDLPLLYWTGASWGSAISLGKDRPEILVDLPAVQALMARALELDESFDDGAIHEALIALEALPAAMGGSPERSRRHFERAVELSQGLKASPYLALAENVSVAAQDRAEFERLLRQALEVDPNKEPRLRLANMIAQRRARHLLARIDELILDMEGDQSPWR